MTPTRWPPSGPRTARAAAPAQSPSAAQLRTPRCPVEACGVCHSDAGFVDGTYPGLSYPVVPGHEIAGRVDAIGDGVDGWQVGDRVAVGWFGGNCGTCESCREGDFIHCVRLQVPGWAYPGGYAEVVLVPSSALARVPDEMTAVEAAPMGCAGVTTFNALRRSSARPGDLAAVLGLGGLGHLGVQFAAEVGFETVAIARGTDKVGEAKTLGAHHYIDGSTGDVAKRLQDLGVAKVVLGTVPSSDAMSATVDGLRLGGELVVVGVTPNSIQVSPLQLIPFSRSVHGRPSGTAREVEETLRFAALTGVRAKTEARPFAGVTAAYHRMLSGDARYRIVLTTGK